MTWIKICGVTSLADALSAARLGVDAVGFNFYRGSPRHISPGLAAEIASALPAGILKVGVFVNEIDEQVERIREQCGLDLLQFHGDEPPSYCERFKGCFLKVLRLEREEDLAPLSRYLALQPEDGRFLIDSRVEEQFGGTGKTLDWNLALKAKPLGRMILSGGLNPENIKVALAKVQPYGVDVASGVEPDPKRFPGKKDKDLLRAFVNRVRQWDRKQKSEKGK